jgi:hypothetical protein
VRAESRWSGGCQPTAEPGQAQSTRPYSTTSVSRSPSWRFGPLPIAQTPVIMRSLWTGDVGGRAVSPAKKTAPEHAVIRWAVPGSNRRPPACKARRCQGGQMPRSRFGSGINHSGWAQSPWPIAADHCGLGPIRALVPIRRSREPSPSDDFDRPYQRQVHQTAAFTRKRSEVSERRHYCYSSRPGRATGGEPGAPIVYLSGSGGHVSFGESLCGPV